MKKLNQTVKTLIATALLVLIAAFGISGTVFSQKNGMSEAMHEYYRTVEREYVKEIRVFLTEQGYSNSGVTMNRITNEDGSMEYVVTIHHRRISRLEESEKEALLAACSELDFPVEDCGFYHKFLEADF